MQTQEEELNISFVREVVAICLGRGRKEATQKRREGKGEKTLVLSTCPPPRTIPKAAVVLRMRPLKTVMRCEASCIQINWGYRGQKALPGSGKGMQGVDRQEARMWESPKVVTQGERKPERKWQRTWARSRRFLSANTISPSVDLLL